MLRLSEATGRVPCGIAARESRLFHGVMALLFAASATATAAWCLSMTGMGAIPMPGGWTLSMAWMPMCGQTWAGAAASFLGMWMTMMAAMMLPSLTPMLARYRQTTGVAGAMARAGLTALVAGGYFLPWALLGLAVFPLGALLAEAGMRWPALGRGMPVAAGLVVLAAGALQFTAWKRRHLAGCHMLPSRGGSSAVAAWRHGLRLGRHCIASSAGFTAILLAVGVMDLGAMAIVSVAITFERLTPAGEGVVRVSGAVAMATGLALVARVLMA